MSPAEYLRRRSRIEWEANIVRHSPTWRKRALKALDKEADATQLVFGKKVVAVRLGSRIVCMKQRYGTEDQARQKIAMIGQEPDGRVKPIRAYPCYTCGGWHVTSQIKNAD